MSVSQCAHLSALRVPACPDRVGVANLMFSAVCRLLESLGCLFTTPVVCFQQLAASTKIPGWGPWPVDVWTFRHSDVQTFRKSKSPALRRGLCHELEQLTSRSGRPTRSVYAGCSVV